MLSSQTCCGASRHIGTVLFWRANPAIVVSGTPVSSGCLARLGGQVRCPATSAVQLAAHLSARATAHLAARTATAHVGAHVAAHDDRSRGRPRSICIHDAQGPNDIAARTTTRTYFGTLLTLPVRTAAEEFFSGPCILQRLLYHPLCRHLGARSVKPRETDRQRAARDYVG